MTSLTRTCSWRQPWEITLRRRLESGQEARYAPRALFEVTEDWRFCTRIAKKRRSSQPKSRGTFTKAGRQWDIASCTSHPVNNRVTVVVNVACIYVSLTQTQTNSTSYLPSERIIILLSFTLFIHALFIAFCVQSIIPFSVVMSLPRLFYISFSHFPVVRLSRLLCFHSSVHCSIYPCAHLSLSLFLHIFFSCYSHSLLPSSSS